MAAGVDDLMASLRREIELCEARLESLKEQLAEAEWMKERLHSSYREAKNSTFSDSDRPTAERSDEESTRWPLSAEEYKRYGRQLIMPEVGLKGRKKEDQQIPTCTALSFNLSLLNYVSSVPDVQLIMLTKSCLRTIAT